jgi:hypothetical protein
MCLRKRTISLTGPYILFFIMVAASACDNLHAGAQLAGFADAPREYTVNEPTLNEVSGIADSKANPGYLWVEQDSGNPPNIGLLKHNGQFLKYIHLAHVVNRDWEDLVLSSGPKAGMQYLYIGETGDNLLVHPDYAIYRLPEPAATVDTVQAVDRIAFFYPDGSHNTEAFLVDPVSKDIYIITKTDLKSKIFRLKYPYSTSEMNAAEEVGSLTYNFAVSAALSPTGHAIMVKTYDAIYFYARKKGESIVQALSKKPVSLPYKQEPQGEAITFANDDSGFFTLSEKALASSVKLYFYNKTK